MADDEYASFVQARPVRTTPTVEVAPLHDIGLVRIQLSLDAPAYLLPMSQARNVGELLIECANKLSRDA